MITLLLFLSGITLHAAQPIDVLTQRKDVVWGFDFLEDERILFTERSGALLVLDPKTRTVSPISGAPTVWARGQGGLLDVRVHPGKPQQIYLTYSKPMGSGATTALGLGTLNGRALKDFKTLLAAHEPNSNEIHFGSRIEFDRQGHVFITIGDRNSRKHVQDLGFHIGKVIRLREDGTVPTDNPFVDRPGARPEIWSLGIRSPQGLALRPGTQQLWLADMGPRGGDELNLVKRGANYGWPEVTRGREYSGEPIGVESKPGMEDPVVYWVPSISPSGLAFHGGDAYLANLSGTHIRRLTLEGDKVVRQQELLKDLNLRFRNLRSGPDGFLYFSTDDGKIARFRP